jgi:hypothetical protein
LFAGDVPVYGQPVSDDDTAVLAYLRALRRIDVCGLLNRDAVAPVGEILRVGTLFALNECDVMIKVTGTANPTFVTVELVLGKNDSSANQNSCDRLLPLALDSLPGAPQQPTSRQPFARVGAIPANVCEVVARVAEALERRLSSTPLPLRDALSTYPVPLAERDPCEVLGVLGDVTDWEIARDQPYECRFSVRRSGSAEALRLWVKLQPSLVGEATDGTERREQDGVEMYVQETYCSVVSFVGPPLQRRMSGGGYLEVPGTVVRPAVVVDGVGSSDCDAVVDVAARAAKLYV